MLLLILDVGIVFLGMCYVILRYVLFCHVVFSGSFDFSDFVKCSVSYVLIVSFYNWWCFKLQVAGTRGVSN